MVWVMVVRLEQQHLNVEFNLGTSTEEFNVTVSTSLSSGGNMNTVQLSLDARTSTAGLVAGGLFRFFKCD